MNGVTYDPAGNQRQMGAGLAMTYDADGRMESSTLNGSTTTYVYNADGRRVLKQTGTAATTYVYDAFETLVAEAGGTSAGCLTCYVAVDHLGSTRQTTDVTGAAVGCHDYLPFGEEFNGVARRMGGCWGTAETTLKFTGEGSGSGDGEFGEWGGLGLLGARYFSGAQGRFTFF
ncbi:MAG: hypothetical protein M3N54_10520 [Acidobacteriota bacterium]|nr:hypothetical protein [Acidobacteriota bacterium]